MKIHCLQHAPFEGLGQLEKILKDKGYEITITKLYIEDELPMIDYHGLIVMGGPMNIYEDRAYPWLPRERAYIKEAIEKGVKVLGICLGSQLIADALGSKVYQGARKEIGWFPIETTGLQKPWQDFLEDQQMVFHWHGDTFDLPKDAILIGHSEGCKCQGFIYKNQVVGLQFHLEMGPDEILRLIQACGDEILDAYKGSNNLYVQSIETIMDETSYFEVNHRSLESLVGQLGW